MTPEEIRNTDELDELLKELKMEVGWDYLLCRIQHLRDLEDERAFELSQSTSADAWDGGFAANH